MPKESKYNYDYNIMFLDDEEYATYLKQAQERNYSRRYEMTIEAYKMIINHEYFSSRFSTHNYYSQAALAPIINKKDTDRFQKVNPITFYSWIRRGLTASAIDYISDNCTKEQLPFIHKKILTSLSIDNLDKLMGKIADENLDYYVMNIFYHQDEKNVIDIVFVKKGDLNSLILEIYTNKVKTSEIRLRETKNEGFDLDNERYIVYGINVVEVNKYLSLKVFPNQNVDSWLHNLELVNENYTKHRSFKIDSFKKYIKECYVPAKGVSLEGKEIIPKRGLYRFNELVKICGLSYNSMSESQIRYARKQNLIGYYKISEKGYRYSIEDFEDYFSKRIATDARISTNRPIISEDEVEGTYLDVALILSYLFPEQYANNKHNRNFLLFHKFKEEYPIYICKVDGYTKDFVKITDVNDYISKNYVRMENGKKINIENNYTYDNIGEVISIANLPTKIKTVNIAPRTLVTYAQRAIKSGELPFLNLTEKNKAIRKDDLFKIKIIGEKILF